MRLNGQGLNLVDSVYERLLSERIIADSDRDRWFTAEEALEYGFVDRIITRAQVNGEVK